MKRAHGSWSTPTLATILAVVLAMPGLAHAVPTDPDAKAHLERGNAAYGKGDFDTAVEEYRKGYAKQDDPAFLYTWAQAERQRGKCAAAVRLYQKYLATDPPEISADYARDGILKCAETMAGDEPMPPGGEDPTATEPVDEPFVDEPEPEPLPPEPKKPRAKWPRDPAGATLVAIGSAGLVAGAALLAVAGQENKKVDGEDTYGDFDDQLAKVRTFSIAGGVALGLGVGLLAGGIARWMIVRKRERQGGDTAVSAMLGRGTVGLTIGRRF